MPDASGGRSCGGRDPVERGRRAEIIAANWLLLRGWDLLERNRRAAGGEIDLIARDGPTLVMVEVRCRRRGSWVGAAASIGPSKRRRLRSCAARLLRDRPDLRWPGRRLRFDVIVMTWHEAGMELRHLPNVAI